MQLDTVKIQKPSPFVIVKRRLTRWTPFFKLAGIVFLVFVLLFIAVQIYKPFQKATGNILKWPNIALSFLLNRGNLAEENGRTNFLLLGVGGGSHEGPDLTDTVIFASINQKTGDTLLLSIPRDIWVDSLKQKVNTAYAIGEGKRKGGGLILAKAAVSEIIGQPIHYATVINFNAFKEAIDLVGGIDVYVERTFDDLKYPKEDDKWEPTATESGDVYEQLHFEKGWHHMDGTTALKFARSRNSEDEQEGTDFARSKRQQKIMLAFKQKVFSTQMLFDITKLTKTIGAFQNNIDTDITEKELPKLARLALKFDEKKLRTVVLDEGTEEKPRYLINPPVEEFGAWILAPRSGSWKDFQEYLKKEIEKK